MCQLSNHPISSQSHQKWQCLLSGKKVASQRARTPDSNRDSQMVPMVTNPMHSEVMTPNQNARQYDVPRRNPVLQSVEGLYDYVEMR